MYDLIIIGGGPSGIGLAAEAREVGLSSDKLLILEKAGAHSASIRKFYPEAKLVTANYKGNATDCEGSLCIPDLTKSEMLDYLDDIIEANSIDISFNETVYGLERTADGSFIVKSSSGTFHSKTCAIAIGILGRPNKPSYRIPSSLKKQVTFDITTVLIQKKKVLVVGGGDSASEYAHYLIQDGNQVTLSYRKDNFFRMNELNQNTLLNHEKNNQVRILRSSNVQEVVDVDGPTVIFEEDDLPNEKFDHVVLALGGSTPINFLKLLNIEFKDESPVLKHGLETSIPGLFLVGDLVQGKKGGSIITAFNSAHQVMKNLCENYLSYDMASK